MFIAYAFQTNKKHTFLQFSRNDNKHFSSIVYSPNPCCISGGQTRPCYTVKLLTETLSLKLKYHSLFLYFLCFLTPQNIRKIVSLQIKTNPCRIKTTNRGVLPLTTCQNLNQRIILKCPQSTVSFISAFSTLSSIYAHFHIFRSRSSH